MIEIHLDIPRPTDLTLLHPVSSLMWERKIRNSKPGKRDDGFKLGLLVEGGGTRGAIGAGGLKRLGELGMRDVVDSIYGVSIGTWNAAWFLSYVHDAITMYYKPDFLRSFVDYKRVLRGKAPLDTDLLAESVSRLFPIDFAAIQDSGIELNILMANASADASDVTICLNQFTDKDDLMKALRPPIQAPMYCGGPIPYKEHLGWDYGLINRIPVERLIDDKCTHILVLSCLPEDYKPKQYNPLVLMMMKHYLSRYNPQLYTHFEGGAASLYDTLAFLREKNELRSGPPYVATSFVPRGQKKLSTTESKAVVLREAIQTAKDSVQRLMMAE